MDPALERRIKSPPRAGPPGLKLTPDDLEAYLDDLAKKGRVTGTLAAYRQNLYALYSDLPADKIVRSETLGQWQRKLLDEGYSPRTVNIRLSVANGLMAFLGRRELQSVGSLEVDDVQPELTRTEYLRLLTTARALDKERLYLLVKLFGSTGIPLQELSRVTVESLREGRLAVRSNGVVQLLHLPDFLRKELLAYARRKGISSGPIFCTKSGKPLGRTVVTDSIKQLCRDARVPEEKATPRCLKRLWQSTQDGIRAQIDLLVEQAYDRLMETEQLAVGWDMGKGVSDV